MSSEAGSSTPARSTEELLARLGGGGPAAVALSGGVDSALVASLAHEALGNRAVALTVGGPSVSARELEQARAVARTVGIDHIVLPADPLSSAEYRANGSDRCYHCRSVEGAALRAFADAHGFVQRLDGIHLDDLGEERPGIRAMDGFGFSHPLLWARWRKADVRREALARGLPNWDRPSEACLASRVARGRPITLELLRSVEAAEAVVLGHGFRRIRVRVDGASARIEVGAEEVARLRDGPTFDRIRRGLVALGFSSVTVDPHGYRGRDESLPVLR